MASGDLDGLRRLAPWLLTKARHMAGPEGLNGSAAGRARPFLGNLANSSSPVSVRIPVGVTAVALVSRIPFVTTKGATKRGVEEGVPNPDGL